MADYNVQMSYLNSDGNYDKLYPNTVWGNISNIPEFNVGKVNKITETEYNNSSGTSSIILSVKNVVDWNSYKAVIFYSLCRVNRNGNYMLGFSGVNSLKEINNFNPELQSTTSNRSLFGCIWLFLCNNNENNVITGIRYPLGEIFYSGINFGEPEQNSRFKDMEQCLLSAGSKCIQSGSFIKVYGIY